ncbi:Outer membrane protein MIP precursor [Aquisphaera giovannonii]|uniref:Peptidyl-prolyl cis-trans isomerase n=1 Tax=Aquisphaera giovannonii TaxID=406548 RepID=A0A5B9W7B7_9BACT|nr:FKBP-type peptidyl-prolyl cis-trans isomerase [Aquisphaera giovannonii]QEH36029.1 Outer membrane protein MIP precursor [Aquisphaera giovannonii]
MKVSLCVAVATGLLAASAMAQEPAAPAQLKSLKDKASYGYGYSMGRNMKTQGIDLDPAILAKGLADGLGGSEALMKDAEIQASIQEFAKQIQAKQAGMAGQAAASNKAEGEKFLAANKKKPGVVTTPSGLQYKVIKQGTGPKPKASDTVTVHYEGKLLDGTVFDSSIKRGEPIAFPLNGVIKGWTEGVQLMPVGSTYQFFIPSELAYGANPRPGGPIGPNAVLTFEVQLLKIGE